MHSDLGIANPQAITTKDLFLINIFNWMLQFVETSIYSYFKYGVTLKDIFNGKNNVGNGIVVYPTIPLPTLLLSGLFVIISLF